MKVEKFIMETVNRGSINFADYNPRTISTDNKNKVKQNIKKYGLVQPIVVNKKTGNVVSGNQRLSILDEINKSKEYDLTVAYIDCTEEDEIKLNIFLNNQSAAGEYDVDILHDILDKFPEIDPVKDAGFDKVDLEFMFDDISFENSVFFNSEKHEQVRSEIDKIANSDKIREYKKKTRGKLKDNELIKHIENDDFSIIFVFNSSKDKRDFMKKIRAKESEKFLSYKKLYDIIRDEYR